MDVNSVATIIYHYWREPSPVGDPIIKPAFPHIPAACVVGDQQGEYGLKWPPGEGDHHKAHGIAQWHADRQQRILDKIRIDISKANIIDQNRAFAWELQKYYAPVFRALLAAQTIEEGITPLVRRYEVTGDQPLDIVKRSAYAEHWDSVFRSLGHV